VKGGRTWRWRLVPNVWHQGRAQRVRCMPGLGDAVKEKWALKDEGGPKAPRGVPRGERGSPRAAPKRKCLEGRTGKRSSGEMARRRGAACCAWEAAGEVLYSGRGRLAVRRHEATAREMRPCGGADAGAL
jgi:hypothetical protein